MTLTQPMGRVTALQYRNVAPPQGNFPTMPVLRVHIKTFDGATDHHDLLNKSYTVQNKALQFMALYDFRPTEIEGTMVEPDNLAVPVAPTPNNGVWGLAAAAMNGGERALKRAEWFNGVDIQNDDGTEQQPTQGGNSDGGGRGGEAVTDDEHDVVLDLADEESDAGVNITIS